MSKALDLARALITAKQTNRTAIAGKIGYSRTAVSLWLNEKYGAGVGQIEEAFLAAFEKRHCPHDGQEVRAAICKRLALRPRPNGFPDAETVWDACQACQFKPSVKEPS